MNTKQLLYEADALCDKLRDMSWAAALQGDRPLHDKASSALSKALRRAIRREQLHERNQELTKSSI